MSKIEVNTVAPQCGTTLTLGESGDTVTLGSGASQSGFGRTGTVDWQTGSIKTSTFTAVNGQGFFCDTNGGAFTCNLPAGSAGAIVSLQDYRNTFDTANLTVQPNGSEKINGGAGPVILSTEGEGITLVYIDGTVGWRSIQDNDFSTIGSNFINATGGTITNTPTCRIHTFTGPGTFTVTGTAVCAANNLVSYMVVAGGGAGGGGYTGSWGAGGGGAGGFRELVSPSAPYTASPLNGYPSSPNRVTVTSQAYPITVGGGGTASGPSPGNAPGGIGGKGGVSTFSTITSAGGGGGTHGCTGGSSPPQPSCNAAKQNGGSGGGMAGGNVAATFGVGNTPPTTPAQGTNGGDTVDGPGGDRRSTGGGGATAAGANAPTCNYGGNGGAGATTEITASPVAYAGGGGGGAKTAPAGGTGGTGGGANGGAPGATGSAGTDNTGGGGGGAGQSSTGGNGGSGVVIIRYKIA